MARAKDPLVDKPGREHWHTYARQGRHALILAAREPDFAKLMLRVGPAEHGEPGGLPADPELERVLFRISRAIQAERRA